MKVMKVCRVLMVMSDKPCRLTQGHKGPHRHDSVWYCDYCGRPRTGAVSQSNGELNICLFCVKATATRQRELNFLKEKEE